ncbi:hypothetical protein ACQJBY_030263 [Aegilops geniculata]
MATRGVQELPARVRADAGVLGYRPDDHGGRRPRQGEPGPAPASTCSGRHRGPQPPSSFVILHRSATTSARCGPRPQHVLRLRARRRRARRACLQAAIGRARSSRGGRGREFGLPRSGQYVAATALSCPRGACCNAHERKRMRRRKKQSKLPRCCVPPQKCHGFVEMETMQEEFSEHDELIHQMADILYTENMSR